jgi:hypothetical protein
MEIAKKVKEIDLREIVVVPSEDGQRSLEILHTMYNHCSDIKSILSEFTDHHEESFWKLTLKATRKGKIKNLKVIPSVHTPELLETYYLPIVQEISDRLKHISIGSSIMATSWNSKDRSNIFCDLLSKTDFPKLEGIDFARANNVSLMNCESIINCCSKYENFKTLSLGINLDIDQNISYDNCCRFITNLPTSDIKILHYKQKNFSDINILYTMHKFPKLKRLSISTRFSMPRIA